MKIPVVLLFLFSVGFSCAQRRDSIRSVRSFGGQFSYQSEDIFLGIHAAVQHGSLEHALQLQYGVRTTFFQLRAFPQLSYQFTWFALRSDWFRAGLFVRPVFSAVNARKGNGHGVVFYEQLLPGIHLDFGKKNRFGLSAMYGPYYEERFSDLNCAYNPYFAWKFNCEISYSYVL